ncbi:MAG: peptidase S41, partial [Deltaproteobacteria bacterium]|nr:peptidase S41 [Deltaproteobacteria bacterium]
MRHGTITTKLKRRFSILLVTLLTFLPLYADPKKEEEAKVPPVPYEELDLFAKVYHYIQNHYVEEVDGKKVIEGAIDGMLRSLDPHSSFLRRDVYNELKVDTEGQFGGIGIEITIKDEVLTVVTPLEGTPAYKAKIEAG